MLDRGGVRPVTPDELAHASAERDRALFGELVDHMADLGDVVADRWRGPITIMAYRGEALAPPVRLDVTPRSVGEHLRTTGVTWRAFLAGVERAAAADPGTVASTLTEDGVAVEPGRRAGP